MPAIKQNTPMFTGIVQFLALVKITELDSDGIAHLEVDLGNQSKQLDLGASVAVNGTCLTVVAIHQGAVRFDVINETLRLTNLAGLQPGDKVNIERSMKVSDEIGGHLLSGHVTDTVTVVKIIQAGGNTRLWMGCEPKWLKYISYKGFVALDGASLTVSAVDAVQHRFAVDLIPETRSRTTLGGYQPGAAINLEIDSQTRTIVDTVERLLDERQQV